MSEVLQLTTETFEVGEEVIIESAITEGVSGSSPEWKPAVIPPFRWVRSSAKKNTAAVTATVVSKEVTRLSMGSDVIDGSGKSVKGIHSSLTALVCYRVRFQKASARHLC